MAKLDAPLADDQARRRGDAWTQQASRAVWRWLSSPWEHRAFRYLPLFVLSGFSLLFFMYDAQTFKQAGALTVLGAESPPRFLLTLLGAPLLLLLPWLLALSWREVSAKPEASASVQPGKRVTRWLWLALTLSFMFFHGATRWLEVISGVLHAEDLEAKLYRDLSTTTPPGLPLYSLFYLVGLGGVAFHWAESLERVGLGWWRSAAAPSLSRLGPAITISSGVLGVLLFFAFTEVVLYATTGGSWLDHLLSVARRLG